ncbi:MAG: GNAT family N-acetyltransferase [Armatimonadota bacterium]|nr:GNAT family N-acetyltransferase [Armatimonadota bacterium]MDR7533202.1 GNAT family N-acetyltransferase [Armatimonadota bacterium]MDR7535410.1 GNAT family N-acetyltransferase [Armatimonadota bacterium]
MKLEPVFAGDARFRDWLRRYREEIMGEPPPDAWLDRYLQVLFADPARRFIWWGVDNGRKVGFVVAVLAKHWADQSRTVGQIGEFFVYPEYRREGLGRKLAQAVIDWLKSHGADEIQSGVVAGNLRGLRFWEACGFQIARYSLVYRPDRPRSTDEEDEDEQDDA